ncbi:hypothetical protein [Brevibacillus brevis]|uniref:hypothetical protein n=1 Tax=Brevibacillus brevis TaxID=1393 RepID=UPI00165E0384|nr:hypothetical protein [Brevibacillus brevis]
MKFLKNTFFSTLLLILLVLPLSASASSTTPTAVPNPTYPGTNIEMKVGDVLYSTKTLGSSSKIVGHVGIVGSDFRVYHVTPAADGGVADSIDSYTSRHGSGETIEIYKYRYGGAANAAMWAKQNYSKVYNYYISLDRLSVMNPNYCSKFIWQAFYYGAGKDVMNKNLTDSTYGIIYPIGFTYSGFSLYDSFKVK